MSLSLIYFRFILSIVTFIFVNFEQHLKFTHNITVSVIKSSRCLFNLLLISLKLTSLLIISSFFLSSLITKYMCELERTKIEWLLH